MEIPSKLLSLINHATANAETSLVYKKPQQMAIEQDGKNYLISYIESLVEKESASKKQKVNPFENPDPKLVFFKDSSHTLLLNKFPITKHHFLLITNEFVRQDSLLSPEELKLTYNILLNLENDGNELTDKPIAFYNSGPNSGSSQPHKHVQFTFVNKDYKLFPDEVVNCRTFFIPDQETPALQDNSSAFSHFIVPLNSENITSEQFGMAYMCLIRNALTVTKDHTDLNSNVNATELSYNFIMTKEWMMVVPRSLEIIHEDTINYDFNINALGYIGMILVKRLDVFNELVNKADNECKIRINDDILLRGGYPLTYVKENDNYDY